MQQQDFQLKWPAAERVRIGNRVLQDYRAAIGDHNKRINRWREYYRRWRASVDPPAQGEEGTSNLPVPYIKWNILTKLAKEVDSLLGDDAEIVAVPVGPSDCKRDKKIGKYMSWRVFNAMHLVKPLCAFLLRKLVFGRSIAYSPWDRDVFEVLDPQGGEPKEVVDYEGPAFQPEWPDDIIVPVEEVDSIHKFSFVIRRFRPTPDELLRGEKKGRYQGITENWEQILNLGQKGMQRAWEGEEIKLEKDEAEGLQYTRPLSAGERLTVLEWYGKWRPLRKGPRGGMPDASEYDTKKREMLQRDFVVRFIPDLNLVISVQDLQQLYPTKKNRRPFVESSHLADGTYWSEGMAEMLINLEDELRSNHNQTTEAGQMAISPPIGYRPASGLTPEMIRLEPGLGIPMDDPSRDIKQIEIHADIGIATWKEQTVLAYGEKLTGQGDLQMGRQSDRPNAPRTAQQTHMLLEEGNVRISLDTKMLREDMSAILSHFWDLEYMFSPEEVFFRVTEEDAGGAFPVQDGGGSLSWPERDGRYDFRLQFANSIYSREAQKEKTLARYQLDLQNPLIVNNPQALWEITNQAHEALGDEDFASLVVKPPAPDLSMDPKKEWTLILQGDLEEVHVRPTDDDLAHMTRHMRDLQMAEEGGRIGPEAVQALFGHYQDHCVQLQQKRIQQAIVEKAVETAQQLLAGGNKPVAMPGGLFGGTPSQPPGNPAAVGPYLYSGHPEVMHEQ